jgi:hypothetical protein
MTDLTSVYEREVGEIASRKRVYFGLALFAVGAAMIVAGIAVATTALGDRLGLGVYEARELAGVLAGLGLPAAFIGSFVLLPASRRLRAAAGIGAALSVFGVVLFREAYPAHWVGSPAPVADLTLPVTAVYFVGMGATFWCLFLAIANFKTRNDPGGTVTMQVTEEGTTVLEVSGAVPGLGGTGSMPGLGSVGLFGRNPDGEVETQTNRGETQDHGDDALYTRESPPSETASQPTTGPAPASDGGSATHPATGSGDAGPSAADDEEFVEAAKRRGRPDSYCGNCEHFQYVRVDGDIRPACTLHEEVMDDMDACEEWTPNN